MARDPPLVGTRPGDDHPTRDHKRLPAATRDDVFSKPASSVHRRDEGAMVDQLRLELDDEQGATTRVPEQEVDDSAFTPDVERHLGRHLPIRRPTSKRPRDRFMQRRVTGVDQSVQFGALSSGHEIHVDIELRAHASDRREGHLVDAAAFHAPDGRLRDAGAVRQVPLPPPTPDPDGPHFGPEPKIAHDEESAVAHSPGGYLVPTRAERDGFGAVVGGVGAEFRAGLTGRRGGRWARPVREDRSPDPRRSRLTPVPRGLGDLGRRRRAEHRPNQVAPSVDGPRSEAMRQSDAGSAGPGRA